MHCSLVQVPVKWSCISGKLEHFSSTGDGNEVVYKCQIGSLFSRTGAGKLVVYLWQVGALFSIRQVPVKKRCISGKLEHCSLGQVPVMSSARPVIEGDGQKGGRELLLLPSYANTFRGYHQIASDVEATKLRLSYSNP